LSVQKRQLSDLFLKRILLIFNYLDIEFIGDELKKVLIASPVVCSPAYSGNSVRIKQFVNALHEKGIEVYFVLFSIREIADRKQANHMESEFGEKFYFLNEAHKIKGTLINRALNYFKRLGLNKTKFGQDTVLPWSIFTNETLNEFSNIVDIVKPDLVIGEYALSAPLIKYLNGKYPTAIDTHDCFTLRNKKIRQSKGVGLWWSLSEKQERDLLSCFDTVIAIQESEKVFFTKLLDKKVTKVTKIDVLELPGEWGSKVEQSIPAIGFIGSNNAHNREGLAKFINLHWLHILKKIPNAKLLIAGDVEVETSLSGVTVLGRVDSLYLDFYSKCSVTVNPCGSGSGLKIKTIESMSYGVPIITTKEGLSGIEQAIGEGAYCCDLDQDEFFLTCLDVLASKNLPSEGVKARKFIELCKAESMNKIEELF
jgi:glycosyltransferase involved in cell wall biosynthesis